MTSYFLLMIPRESCNFRRTPLLLAAPSKLRITGIRQMMSVISGVV